MKLDLRWQQGVAFQAEMPGGHTLLMDAADSYGGSNRGPRPMETLLSAAAACSAIDVVHILHKGKQSLTDLLVQVTAERATTEPAVFTSIHLHYVVSGTSLRDSLIARAVELGVEKYCSALRMLSASCQVTHSWENAENAEIH